MNIIPTLEGGLRIDLEEPIDWVIFRHLIDDACQREGSLAEDLGEGIEDPEIQNDWLEFVMPDLEEEFASSLKRVSDVLAKAAKEQEDGTVSLWITRDLGFDWYSSFNQARISLGTRYQFEETKKEEIAMDTNPSKRSAYYRYHFYGMVQVQLLKHVLK